MKQAMTKYKGLMLVLVLMVPVLSACGLQVAADAAEQDTDATSYGGALDLSYEGMLDATSQLALGTLQLEGTELAVTEAQAGDLLALWQVLISGELQGDGETNAVLKQTEAAMTANQVSAIAGLRLTQEDTQAWLEESDSAQAGDTSAGQAPAGMQRPEGMEDMTDEEREKMRAQQEQRAQMQAQIGSASEGSAQRGAFGGVSSMALTRAVVELLTERSGSVETQARAPDGESQVGTSTAQEAAQKAAQEATQETTTETSVPKTETETESTSGSASPCVTEQTEQTEVVEPEASETEEQPELGETDPTESDDRESVSHTVRAGESLASIAVAYGVSVASIVEANAIQDANLIAAGQELAIPAPAQVPDATAEIEAPVVLPVAVTAPEPALEELADTDPGPPLAIEVSANRATQDPLVEQSRQYLVTGVVRNDGEETYAVSSILATFFEAEGFRGSIDRKIRDGQVVSAEWNWHGQTEAEFAALLLAPGEEWPFSIEITAQDMASFLLHPDAVATERESAPVELSGVQVVDEGTGYLRFSGTATNENVFDVKNVTLSGVLLDASGQIVSLGSTYVIQEDIASGESVHFHVRVAKELYVGYELYAQAERDWS